jgi:transposase
MYIRKTVKTHKGKTYTNHLLVESIHTPKGPRQQIICSLGSLSPGPREQWLTLAHKLGAALQGQLSLTPTDPQVARLVEQVHCGRTLSRPAPRGPAPIETVAPDRVTIEEAREAGPVHVGHQMWRRLGLEAILRRAGLSARACTLSEAMALNRLVAPRSEHAMPDWIRRTAMGDLVGTDFSTLNDEALYRTLDRLHPNRERIERELAERERTLFNLDDTVYLYDLTSSYFEGQCALNPQAKRGYSRDKRPDCKQVVVGLVVDREGFPQAHEVFDGNRTDRTTVDDMLDALEARTGRKEGATVVVDRGMAFDDNLKQITARGYHYLVASRQGERQEHLDDFEDEAGWEELVREPSPRNPAQQKTHVVVKRRVVGEELHLLCRSDGRDAKDRAIRETHEQRWLTALKKLHARVATGRLTDEAKVHQAIGRLKERYPRVARYYQITYDAQAHAVRWQEDTDRTERARRLDGSYMLKTDRTDWTGEDIWRTYMLLTRVESAFRAMKSPLAERPIFHHLERRVQTHIFLCVLAYHLLISIEKMFRDAGVHTSWDTLRAQLSTHQVVTVVLPTTTGKTVKIRKGTTPEPTHREIYATLKIPLEVMKPVTTWYETST